MAAKDRTAEFMMLVAGLQQERAVVAKPRRTPARMEPSQFARLASRVSQETQATALKLAELTKLAKQRSLHQDPTDKIHQLTCMIKDDITRINSELDLLTARVQASRGAAGQTQVHTENMVAQLKSTLITTTEQFKSVLEQRTQTMREQQQRRGKFGIASPAALGRPLQFPPPPRALGQAGVNGSAHHHHHHAAAGGAAAAAGASAPVPAFPTANDGPTRAPPARGARRGGYGGNGSAHAVPVPGAPDAAAEAGGEGEGSGSVELAPLLRQSQQLLPESDYYASRAEAMRDIESHIVDLSAIFNRLGGLIAEQHHDIARIGDNVDTTLLNVESGTQVLHQLWDRVSSNQALVLRILGVLVLFAVLFIVFLA